MTTSERTAGSVLRQTLAALIIVPLAVVFVAFAVANRHLVTVSLDPFGGDPPAASLTLPLFVLVIVLLIVGVLLGSFAAWLRQTGWRRIARRLERDLSELRAEVDRLRHAAAIAPPPPEPAAAERLQLRPPGS